MRNDKTAEDWNKWTMMPNNTNKSVKELDYIREIKLQWKIKYLKLGCYVMTTHDYDEKEK